MPKRIDQGPVNRTPNRSVKTLSNGRVVVTKLKTEHAKHDPGFRERMLECIEELDGRTNVSELTKYMGETYSATRTRLITMRKERLIK